MKTANEISVKTFRNTLNKLRINQPDATALKYRDQKDRWAAISWKELYLKADQASRGLRELRMSAGDRLIIMAKNCLEWEVLFYGCQFIGVGVAGAEPYAALAQKVMLIKGSRAKILAVDKLADVHILPEQVFNQLSTIIHFDESKTTSIRGVPVISWSELLSAAKDEQDAFILPETENSGGIVIFTSGTTGNPRPLRYSQEQMLLAAETILGALGVQAGRLACYLPLANAFQRIINTCALHVGAQSWLVARPTQLIRDLKSIKPTILIAVPLILERIYEQFLKIESRWPASLKKLLQPFTHYYLRKLFGGRVEMFISGSAPLSEKIYVFFHKASLPIYEAYGLSENIVPIAMNVPAANRAGSVGKPLRGNDVVIDESSEILVRGPGQAKRYDGAGTPTFLNSEGYYKTGDFGHFDRDGYLYIDGRDQTLFKTSNGRKISAIRIENQLKNISEIEQVVVMGHGRKWPVAIVTLRELSNFDELKSKIKDSISQLPEPEKIRGVLILLDKLSIENRQLTANFKMRRNHIGELHRSGLNELYNILETQRDPSLIMLVEKAGGSIGIRP